MKQTFAALAVLALALTLVAAPAAAQSCTPNANTALKLDGVTSAVTINNAQQRKIHSADWDAQTFTVLGSGCFKVNQVTVRVRKTQQGSTDPADLVIALYDTVFNSTLGFVVPNSLLASVTKSASSITPAGTFVDVTGTFSTPPTVTGGAQFAVVLFQASPGGSGQRFYEWFRQENNPYDGGRWFKSADSGSSWDSPSGSGGGIDALMSICVSSCVSGCTYTQGFWKTHGGDFPAANPNPNAWPVSSLTLGTQTYNQADLLAILRQSVDGNGLVSLAHQLIAAKLNVANGASVPAGVATAISSADALIGSLIIPPVGAGFLSPDATSALTTTLDMYNNGTFPGGPGHCGDE